MNNNFGISDTSIRLILQAIEEIKEIDRAVIFGSRAISKYKKGSDIDLAIYGESLSSNICLSLNARLNEELPIPYHIDVVAPKFIENENLINHIDRVGKVLYSRK